MCSDHFWAEGAAFFYFPGRADYAAVAGAPWGRTAASDYGCSGGVLSERRIDIAVKAGDCTGSGSGGNGACI